jgi:hypothetical protein
MNEIILRGGWRASMSTLIERGTSVTLADGAHDPVPVQGRHAEIARQFSGVTHVVHPCAGHELPLVHPEWCRRLIDP